MTPTPSASGTPDAPAGLPALPTLPSGDKHASASGNGTGSLAGALDSSGTEQKPKPRASANANGSGSLTGSLEKPATTEPTQPRSFTSPVKASANADGNAYADATVSAHQPQ